MNNEIRTISEIDSLYAIYRLVSQRHPIDSQTRTFLNYCKKQSKDGLFSQAMIDNWCCKCENEKNNTHYNRVKVAENIIKFANERGYCCIDLNSKVKWGKTKHRLVMLDQQEMVSFFKACDEQTFYETGVFKKRGQCYELVCKAIFRLLYSNGLRPIEARLLRIEDVDLRNGIIYISKESRIPSPIQISITASVSHPNMPNHPILSAEQPRNYRQTSKNDHH